MPTQSNPRNATHIGTQSGSGYVWLVYSIFYFIEPILRHSNRFWIQSIAIYAVFLAIYIGYAESRTNRQRYVLITAFYVLGLLVFPFNSGATCFFIYSAAFLPFIVASTPHRRARRPPRQTPRRPRPPHTPRARPHPRRRPRHLPAHMTSVTSLC